MKIFTEEFKETMRFCFIDGKLTVETGALWLLIIASVFLGAIAFK